MSKQKVKCECGVEHTKDLRRGLFGRLDKFVEVEDHGNGFLFLGTNSIEQAHRLVADYVDNAAEYVFAAHTLAEDSMGKPVHAVWLTVEPFQVWDGATEYDGTPLPR